MQVPQCKGICRICQPRILIYHLLTMIINLVSLSKPPSFDKEAIRTAHDPRMHAVISPHPWNQPSSTHGFFQSIGAVHRVSQDCVYVLTLVLVHTTHLSQKKLPRKAQPSWRHWIGSSLKSPNPSYSTWRFDWTVGSFSFLWLKIPLFFLVLHVHIVPAVLYPVAPLYY